MPGITVKGSLGASALVAGADYTLAYPSGSKDVGTHEVVASGIGNYSGSLTGTFDIVPAKPVVKSLKAGKKRFTLKLGGKASAYGGTTFNIAYRAKGTKAWQYTTASAASKVVKKLKKGKKYQVKVQVQKKIAGAVYTSAWSATKTTKKVK